MSDLTKFSEGAAILQQVDVSDIFRNLAMGIAEAQEKLDDNSVAQAIRLAQTQINGVSLITMGFQPMFYAFQYADISASINLQMAAKETLDFGFEIDFKLGSKKGYTETDRQFLQEDNYSETKQEYKTSKQLSFRAKERNSVKIDKKYFKQREDLESKSRLERFKDDIKESTAVEQIYEEIKTESLSLNLSRGVDVWMDAGFLRLCPCIHYNKSGVGVLKIKKYDTDKFIDVNSTISPATIPNSSNGEFNLETDLQTSLLSAYDANFDGTTGEVYGLSSSGELYKKDGANNTWIPISSKIYFKYAKDDINYTDNLKNGPNDLLSLPYPNNKNHNQHTLIHQILRLIQSNDPDSNITITGVTDPAGNKGDNEKLATRRALNLKEHIFGTAAKVNVKTRALTTDSPADPSTEKSNLLSRFAEISLDADYIIFIDGKVTKDASPKKADLELNKFIYADQATNPTPFNLLKVNFGNIELEITESVDFQILVDKVKTAINEVSYEKKEEHHYFLHNEAIVKFQLLTNQSEEIDIEQSDEESTDQSTSENTFLSSKTKNEKSQISDKANSKSQKNSTALHANVDLRMTKQFEMSMQGNASMSARLVAVPAPPGFVTFIQNIFILNNSGNIDIN